MVKALCRRALHTEVHKQRARVGKPGNQMADGSTKNTAMGRADARQLRSPVLDGSATAGQREPFFHVDGTPITRVKQQLRGMAGHCGYRHAVKDMWAGSEASKLDRKASNEAVWGTSDGRGPPRVEQVLCARILELRMIPVKHRDDTRTRIRQAEKHPLCSAEGNWSHRWCCRTRH
eukprot:9503799-Pyramimonas_sp.AAC.1